MLWGRSRTWVSLTVFFGLLAIRVSRAGGELCCVQVVQYVEVVRTKKMGKREIIEKKRNRMTF